MLPDEKKKVKDAIQELSNSMTRIDAEKDLMKDIVQATFDSTGIDKKKLRKLATIYHKQIMDQVRTETNDLDELYEDLFS